MDVRTLFCVRPTPLAFASLHHAATPAMPQSMHSGAHSGMLPRHSLVQWSHACAHCTQSSIQASKQAHERADVVHAEKQKRTSAEELDRETPGRYPRQTGHRASEHAHKEKRQSSPQTKRE